MATAEFAFSGSDPGGSGVASFECRLDGGSWAGCASPKQYSGLGEGSHLFEARATDGAGNVDATPASFAWQVDLSAPQVAIDSLSKTLLKDGQTSEVSWHADENGSFELRVGGGDCSGGTVVASGSYGNQPAQQVSNVSASQLAEGANTLRLCLTDVAGNRSSTTTSVSKDSDAPDTQIDSHPAALVNVATAEFAFSGSDPGGSGVASFECRRDGGSWAGCASPKQYSGLGEGAHLFEARATDGAGNVDATPASFEWQVDLSAPQVAIDSLSKTLLKDGQTSEVSWHADENGSFELRVGGGDCSGGTVVASGAYSGQPAQQVSNVSASQLAEGANTLRLCLTDAAGNRSSTTTSVSKDSDAPDTQIDSMPAAFTTATSAEFTFSGSDPGGSGVASFECRRDGAVWAACIAPKQYTGLTEGAHTFEVKTIDKAGNADPIPASFDWHIDLTPPNVQINSGPDGLTSNPLPTFGFSSEPSVTFACSIDEGTPTFASCSGTTAHTPASPLAEGTHTFRVRATDQAGNQATAARSFTVDTTAPPEPVLSSTLPASPANDNSPQLFGTALSGATVALYSGGTCNGTPLATVSAAELEAGVTVGVADDSDTIFRANVTAGERTSGCSEPLAYVEDSTAPETAISSPPPATTMSTLASFFFNASEPSTSFECSLDGAPVKACGPPRSYAGLAPGPHSFTVRATDPAGNVEPEAAAWSWTIEPPVSAPPSACEEGGTQATTAAAVRTAVAANQNVCVTADVGDVNLSDLGAHPVVVSTEDGSMAEINVVSTTDLTISRARFRSIELRGAHRTKLLDNTIGGTQAERVYDQLIFMPTASNDVAIEGNDIGWTLADMSGNTGYGCRCYGDLNRLRFVGNRLHDLTGDGFQGVGGVDVLIDRNEIGPVGRNPESNEHSDNIQIIGNEQNLHISNNWLHHQGYFEGEITANSGSTYIHGGTAASLTFENNLIETAQGRTEVCGLGSGGEERSNLTIRRNTWVEGGLAFNNFPGFEWDCDSGTNNIVERNIAVDADGGLKLSSFASAATFLDNLWGEPSLVTLDAAGNCTSANCNPAGAEPIGYRKPSGAGW